MSDSEDSIGIVFSRVRNLTKKGKTYHLQVLEDQRSSAQGLWQKQLNRVINVIVDTTKQNLIMSERTFREAKMEILCEANKRLYDFLEGNYDVKKEALTKFESTEREHSDGLRKVNKRICELKQETGSQLEALIENEGDKVEDYCSFMQDIISSGYAERVPFEETFTTSKQV